MASTFGNNLYESQSITKPRYFNGDNYPYWKNCMRLFIKSNDYQVWDVVEDGSFIPSKREMSFCTSAKEIDKLETTYEGTNDVKETKIELLNLSYENFKMEPNEEITKIFDRFSIIVNGLKGLGEVIPEEKLVRKLIYSLPEEEKKRREGKGRENDGEERSREEEDRNCSQSFKRRSDSSGEEDDEEMTMLVKSFTRFMKSQRGRRFQRKLDLKNKSKEEEKDQHICYDKRPRHISSECPQLKKKALEGRRSSRLKLQLGVMRNLPMKRSKK
ncbi:hypothetical protein GQ457_04G022310 [Hibiscus cannabinus]